MGKSASAKQDIVDYRMSIHFGVSLKVDKVKRIRVNEKTAWEGSISELTPISVYQPDLFGGIKKEGGLVGTVYYLPGNDDQEIPEALAAKLGRTSENCPAYRGLATIWFCGDTSGAGPFLWSSNSPIIAQSVDVTVESICRALSEDFAVINGDQVNPSHLIFECLTNNEWGMGESSSSIDISAFMSAAETLYNEAFGLSLLWARQSKIEEFIGEVLDHIQATFFLNPRTGLLTLKLIRDDYDVNTLRQMGPHNAKLKSFGRKVWGETVNEIVVSWTNPVTEKEETVSAMDLANISIQNGAVISDNRNYYAVRNKELAARLAARDLRTSSAPLAAVDVELDRRAWDLLPGDVVLVNWPEHDLVNIVMRVGPVNYGSPGARTIKASLIEDIFSLERPVPNVPPDTGWTPNDEIPTPISYTQVITLPAYFVVSTEYQAAEISLTYPEVAAAVLAHQPGVSTPTFDLMSEDVLPNGDVVFAQAGTKTTIGRYELEEPLVAEATSLLPAANIHFDIRAPRVGGFIFIGNVADEAGSGGGGPSRMLLSGDESGAYLLSGDQDGALLLSGNGGAEEQPDGVGESGVEIALVYSYDSENYTLARGVLDTVPREWPAGTPMWFINPGIRITDDKTIRSAGEEVDYKLRSRTSLGLLPEIDAPVVTGTLSARPHLPYRPANVQVNGVGFGSVAAGAGSLLITWANRNRELEDGQILTWTEPSVPPEYRQETIVTVRDMAGVIIYQQTGLWTETSLALPVSYFARYPQVKVTVQSRRDGMWSLQGHSITVTGLANNAAADPPPAPPTPGPPPVKGAAPSISSWIAKPYSYEGEGGSLPGLLVEGSASDNPLAEGVLIELLAVDGAESGDWDTIFLGPATLRRVPINSVSSAASYYVGISYQVGGIIGERLVLGPVAASGLSVGGGAGGGTSGTVSPPVSASFQAYVGAFAPNIVAVETSTITIPGEAGQLSVTLNGFCAQQVSGTIPGTWDLRIVTAAGETSIATGVCGYGATTVVGQAVGDMTKVNGILFPVVGANVVVRLYVKGLDPAPDTGKISGTIMALVYGS